MEGLNKDYNTRILVSSLVLSPQVKSKIITRYVGRVAVTSKRKRRVVDLFEVIGRRTEVSDQIKSSAAQFSEGLQLYLAQQFQDAAPLFAGYVQAHPEDRYAQSLYTQCKEYIDNPPEVLDWDGAQEL